MGINDVDAKFDELSRNRRQFVDTLRLNHFEEGIKRLLTDLYPDNAHFIYELLQNAEDAGATRVNFDLRKHELRVAHNGRRLFTIEDVDGITSIGGSTKTDDETAIGEFGVGFKAVFAYTNTPEIRSGDFAFKIHDLVVPIRTSIASDPNETLFILPFDRKEKDRGTAFKEISRDLRRLDGTALLFLSNISEILLKTANGETGSILRNEEASPVIKIHKRFDDHEEVTEWFRLMGPARRVSGDSIVGAAFSLHQVHTREGDRLRIQPVEAGATCIYFPAVKEVSGLRFHIHAPFASTVARESVRNTDENKELVLAIADLIVDELPKWRDSGLIDDGLLATLPNKDDQLSSPYDQVRSRVVEAFRTAPLTPVYGGNGYAPAHQLLSSPAEFRRGLDQSDLPTLLGLSRGRELSGQPMWVSPREGRARRFLDSLDIDIFGWDQISDVIYHVGLGSKSTLELWNSWLETKSDDQLRAFYELLGIGLQEEEIEHDWEVPIIRVRHGQSDRHVLGTNIYFPRSDDDVGPDRVLSSLCPSDDLLPAKTNIALKIFLEHCGLRQWDKAAEVQHRLEKYIRKNPPDWQEHLEDIVEFIQFRALARSSYSSAAVWESHKLLVSVPFVSALNRRGKRSWVAPPEIVIGSPFIETGLDLVFPDPLLLDPQYAEIAVQIVQFLEDLGARTQLEIEATLPWDNPEFQRSWRYLSKETTTTIKEDWDIPEFERIVHLTNPGLMKLLWELAVSSPSSYAKASYQANRSSQVRVFRSKIAQKMMSTEWILDRNGFMRSTSSMTVDDLPEGWSHPGHESLAAAVGFGQETANRERENIQRQEAANQLDIPIELADVWRNIPSDKQSIFLSEIQSLSFKFPGFSSSDPNRRGKRVFEDALNAPEYNTEKRTLSVASGESETVLRQAKQYLREQYSDNTRVFCQACHLPSEFEVKGSAYFEAVAFLSKRKRMHHQNYLALCPMCAAKYKYVRNTDDAKLLHMIQQAVVTGDSENVDIHIHLYGRGVNLRFTARHAIDIQAALRAAGEER
jgi:hypothetical protein